MNRTTAPGLPRTATRKPLSWPQGTAVQEPRLWGALRLALYALLITIAVLIARSTSPGMDGGALAWLMLPLAIVILAAKGAFRRSIQLDVATELARGVIATTLAAVLLVAGAALISPDSNPAALILRTWGFATALISASTPLIVVAERRARRSGADLVPTLVVGAGLVGTQIERRLQAQPELGLRVIGFIDADPVPEERVPGRQAPVLGSPENFIAIAEETGAQRVILTFISSPDRGLVPLIRACEDRGIEVSLVPRLFESVNLRLSVDNIGPLPLFSLSWVDPKGWQFAIKHGLDRVLSAVAILVLLPVLVTIAAAVKLSSPGPILFRQRRIGRDGRRFDMFKFRSMRVADAPPSAGEAHGSQIAPGGVEGDDRRTAVGRFIRRYSLDELPQLFNVLLGQMSLIGPRPERPEFVEVFDEEVRRYSDRHRVKSGITGLAQVSGFRGKTSLRERVELDNYYIQNWSMGLDLRIALRTFSAIFKPAE